MCVIERAISHVRLGKAVIFNPTALELLISHDSSCAASLARFPEKDPRVSESQRALNYKN